ncbi:MAG: phage tail protein [Pseudomonas sp.]|nr:phage tail protein [Pseudomonas sp.]
MDTKIVYQTDHLGIYVGTAVADRSPLEPDAWLLPGGCVEEAPPAVPEHQAALWDGERWQLIDSYHGLTAYNVQTREAITIERHGRLPAGYTLEVPGAQQLWNGSQWVDDVPALVERRYAEQVQAVNAACEGEISAGFWSSALGEQHRYDSQLEDQINLTGMVLRAVAGPYACRDEQGVKAFRAHSAEQLRQVGDEFTGYKLERLQKAHALKVLLAEARELGDLDAIEALGWEADLP